MNLEFYKDRGLTGLANLGNTCFINTCLQMLSNTYELNQFLDDEKYKNKLKNKHDSLLLLEWDNLRKLIWSQNCVISPGKFVKTIQQVARIKGADLFTGYSQNDLPEFLLFLVDSFHNSIAREVNMSVSGRAMNDTDKLAVQCYEMVKKMFEREYSEIWNLFYGIHVSQLISLDNKEVLRSTPEPYFMIDLPILKESTLEDCFKHYVNGEILEGENAWYNETTGLKQDVQKRIIYWSMPTILVIDFKRFNERNQKNQTLVSFPLDNLNLSEYVIGYKKDSYIYDLYGICNHSGNAYGGHYYAYIKNANGKWYEFNDTQITEITNVEKLVTPKAYCLFYRKKTLG